MKRSKRRDSETFFVVAIYVILILFLMSAIKSFIAYNGMFEHSIFDASLKYQGYALIYIIQFIIFSVVLLLTIKLIKSFNGKLRFSRDNEMLLYIIAMCILIYCTTYSVLELFVKIESEYYQVLNSHDMTNTLLLVVGGFMVTIAIVYGKSLDIKEENDLTI